MKVKGKIVDLSLDFVSQKPRLTFQLTSQYDVLSEEFNKLQKEELLDINFDKHREQRGLQPNAYFHVLINKLARYFNISDEEMKAKMNLQYGTIATDKDGKVLGCKVPKGTDIKSFYPYAKWYKEDHDGCDCYLFYKRTHTLNSLEFSKLIDGVVWECKQVGIETLSSDELNRLKSLWEQCFK